MYDEVTKMRSDVETMKQYMHVFTDKLAEVMSLSDTTGIRHDISSLSYKIEDEINKLKSEIDDRIFKNEMNIDKNDNNIKTVA